MAKSLLKTKIQELFSVTDRGSISFVVEEDGDQFVINVDDRIIFSLELRGNEFCCGILELGDTLYSFSINGISVNDLSDDDRNELYYLIMEQAVKSISEAYGNKGLLSWTHIDSNSIVNSLITNPESSWKLVNEFHNPNSGNTVCQFTAVINQG